MKLSKLTTEEIKRRLELCEKATPGPWSWIGQHYRKVSNLIGDIRGIQLYGPYKAVSCGVDANYIAAHDPTVMTAIYKELLAARNVIKNYAPDHRIQCSYYEINICDCGLPEALDAYDKAVNKP